MLTRCPHCQTRFRVTPEQLKLRLGQVRCGACREVFDAFDSLLEEAVVVAPQPAHPADEIRRWRDGTAAAPPPPSDSMPPHAADIVEPSPLEELNLAAGVDFVIEPEPEAAPLPDLPAVAELVTEPSAEVADAPAGIIVEVEEALGYETAARADSAHMPQNQTENAPATETIGGWAAEDVAKASPVAPTDTASDSTTDTTIDTAPDTATDIETMVATDVECHVETDAGSAADSGPEPDPEVDPEGDPEGDPGAENATEPEAESEPEALVVSRPARHWPWVLALIVLFISGLGQLVYIYRAELAVHWPPTRPLLTAACAWLDEPLPRLVRPELMVIESSDLAPEGNYLVLSATLHNRATFSQDYPHLELTLTDAQEAVLIRKSLAPADYLPADIRPANGMGARDEISLRLTLDAGDVPAVGYRLYLFYP